MFFSVDPDTAGSIPFRQKIPARSKAPGVLEAVVSVLFCYTYWQPETVIMQEMFN
jgi:hypothetical protein